MALQNPFQYGRELGAEELVDREDEIRRVSRTVEYRGKLFLIGPRRYGKTSILKVAGDALRSAGAMVQSALGRLDLAGFVGLVRPWLRPEEGRIFLAQAR